MSEPSPEPAVPMRPVLIGVTTWEGGRVVVRAVDLEIPTDATVLAVELAPP